MTNVPDELRQFVGRGTTLMPVLPVLSIVSGNVSSCLVGVAPASWTAVKRLYKIALAEDSGRAAGLGCLRPGDSRDLEPNGSQIVQTEEPVREGKAVGGDSSGLFCLVHGRRSRNNVKWLPQFDLQAIFRPTRVRTQEIQQATLLRGPGEV